MYSSLLLNSPEFTSSESIFSIWLTGMFSCYNCKCYETVRISLFWICCHTMLTHGVKLWYYIPLFNRKNIFLLLFFLMGVHLFYMASTIKEWGGFTCQALNVKHALISDKEVYNPMQPQGFISVTYYCECYFSLRSRSRWSPSAMARRRGNRRWQRETNQSQRWTRPMLKGLTWIKVQWTLGSKHCLRWCGHLVFSLHHGCLSQCVKLDAVEDKSEADPGEEKTQSAVSSFSFSWTLFFLYVIQVAISTFS